MFTKDEFKAIKEQIDYGRTFSLMNNEVMKFDEIYSYYRNFLITSMDKRKGREVIDSNLTSYELNDDVYREKIINYALKLRNKIDYEANYDESTNQRLGLLMNLLIDTTILDEVYENFFEPATPFNNQAYL